MKLSFDHDANAEIYKWGVEDTAGLVVKNLTKFAVSRMFFTKTEEQLLCCFPDVNQSIFKHIVFSPLECTHELSKACEHNEKTPAVNSWPQSRRGHECIENLL